ncbi:MAG: ATP-binding protein [Prevotella sp.]
MEYPLSFSEYLRAIDSGLYSSYMMIDGSMPVPEVLHGRLVEAYKAYLALGGMPEAVSDFADNREWQAVQTIQENILKSYSLDFSKHINNKDIPRVFQVWNSLQDQLAKEDRKFRYADIQKGARAREYESAIEWLCLAGIVQRVNMIETPRLPLSAYSKSNAFKLYLNDVGLLCSKFSLSAQSAISGNRLFTEFKGILSENYVLQSLRRQFGDNIFYWTSGNTAEVEFVLQMDNDIVPVEVKSENNVKAKSLSIYRKTYSPSLSLRFSTRNIRKDDDFLNLPLYLADRISDIHAK